MKAERIKAALGDIKGLRTAIEESPFDAVVAVSPENVRYAGDVYIGTQISVRDRLAMILWPKGREPIFLVGDIEEGYVREVSWIEDVRIYVEFKTSPIELLANVLGELGLEKGRIGIELEYLFAYYYQELRERLPGLKIEKCEEFERTRMVKTQGEKDLLARAARATEKALLATYATIQPGETEKSMANRLASNIMHCGADKVKFLYINGGPNTGFPHMQPSDYAVKRGDIIKTDCGGVFTEYISDIARTAVVGKPSADQRSIYQRLMEVHRGTIDKLRPGNKPSDVFNTAVELYRKVDIPFKLPHCGHSVGIGGHEKPILNPFDHTILKPNMMFYVETRVRWPGKEGYHIEDLIQVTEKDPVVHTTFFDNAELYVI